MTSLRSLVRLFISSQVAAAGVRAVGVRLAQSERHGEDRRRHTRSARDLRRLQRARTAELPQRRAVYVLRAVRHAAHVPGGGARRHLGQRLPRAGARHVQPVDRAHCGE